MPSPASKNYITPSGMQKIKAELQHLLYEERPSVTKTVAWAASNGDRSENGDYIYGKRRLREIDRRIRFLTGRIEIAEIIDPASVKSACIQFGATIQLQYEDNSIKQFQIVGVDESDPSNGRISWISPLAKALLGKKTGDVFEFETQKGSEEIEVKKVIFI